MNGKIVALVGIGTVVALGIAAAVLLIPQGPVTFDSDKYLLGENIFVKVRDIQANEKGNIVIFTPMDVVYMTKQYDGSLVSDFNFYFTPDTVKHRKICTPADLVGKWKVVIGDSKTYPPAYFEVTDKILKGFEKHLDVVC